MLSLGECAVYRAQALSVRIENEHAGVFNNCADTIEIINRWKNEGISTVAFVFQPLTL